MNRFHRLLPLAVLAAPLALAQTAPAKSAAPKVTMDQLLKQQQEMMNELIQQRAMLLRMIEGKGSGAPATAPAPTSLAMPPPPVLPTTSATPPATPDVVVAKISTSTGPKKSGLPSGPKASVTGQVSVSGSRAQDIYVFIEDVRGTMAKGQSLEIQQREKQFHPKVSVVQRGTTLVFPNYDAVFHNVFSVSPGNSFDLGTYQAGDAAKSAVMTSAGVVDVFCNLHSRMSATVLVVPGPLYAKVGPDGRFKIDNVPLGSHKIVAWTPGSSPSALDVSVSATGGEASFSLESVEKATHTNKYGQPYGSYGD